MIMLLVLVQLANIFAQGMAINIIMRKVQSEIDTRFFHQRFYWKPILPALYRSAKTGILSVDDNELRFSPPFSKHIQEK